MSVQSVAEKKPAETPAQQQKNYNNRRRTLFFEDSFAYKDDSTSSARDRVTKDAPIIADLRTNVIVSIFLVPSLSLLSKWSY
jgi:hypothetical protein